MNRFLRVRLSFTSRIIAIVTLSYFAASASIMFLANKSSRRIVNESQSSVYRGKIEGILRELKQRESRVIATGLPESYRLEFQEIAVEELNAIYSTPSGEGYELTILDDQGRILIPAARAGEWAGSADAAFREMIHRKRGELNLGEREGIPYWFVFDTFEDWEWLIAFGMPMKAKYLALHRLNERMISIVAGSMGIILAGLSMVLIGMMKSIKELTSAARMISQGDFNRRIDTEREDELGILAGAFRDMQEAVRQRISELAIENLRRKKAEEKLRSLNESLELRVRYRTQELEGTMDDLKEAQKQLVEADKFISLGNMVAGIAHEINTPVGIGITGISHCIDLVTAYREKYDDLSRGMGELIDDALRTAELVQANLERVSFIIRDFKQISADQTDEILRPVRITEYLESGIESFLPRLQTPHYAISIQGDEDLVITTYPGILMQVITNLYFNAVNHAFSSSDQGTITLEARRVSSSGYAARIDFSDDGEGIPPEDMPRLFDAFFTTKREHGGTGLGLYIVYNLVTTRLRGSVLCRSESGKGTTFSVHIPDLAGDF